MRRCQYCETLVDGDPELCPFCGKEIGPAPPPVASTTTTYTGYGSRSCIACGRDIQFDASVCPYCGHDYRIPLGVPATAQKTSKPVVGGVLIVIAGLLAIAMGAFMMSLQESDFDASGAQLPEGYTIQDVLEVAGICGIILIAFAVLAIIGGLFGIRRKSFALAVVGGVFALLGLGFVIGSILGLVGLILILMSRQEFG